MTTLDQAKAKYGAGADEVEIPHIAFTESFHQQVPQGLRTGPEVDRASVQGTIPVELATFSGGLLPTTIVRGYERNLDKLFDNEGLQHHIPGILCPCYDLTTQAELQAVNASGYRAANVRAHSVNTAAGAGVSRYYVAAGRHFMRETSTSNPALIVAHTFADKVTAMRELVVAGSPVLVVATAGTTDGICYTTDPTAGTVTWTELFPLSAGDYIDAMESMPTLGGGINLFHGKIGGAAGIWYTHHSDPAGTQPKPVVLAASADQDGTLAIQTATLRAAGARNVRATDIPWQNLQNITTSDDNRVTLTLQAGEISDYLVIRYTGQDAVPAAATIRGLELKLERSRSTGTFHDIRDEDLQLVLHETRVGVDDQADTSTNWPTTDAVKTYGGPFFTWGRAWSQRDLYFLELLVQVKCAGTETTTARVDYSEVVVYYQLPGEHAGTSDKGGGSMGGWGAVGGFSPGKLPSLPTRWPIVAPVRDDPDGVTLQRELWFLDFSWDPSRNGPVVSISKPNTGMHHIEAAANGLGGIVLAGDNSAGLGKSVRFVRGDGEVMNLSVPTVYRFKDVGVSALTVQGRFVLVEIVNEDGTDAQTWYYFDGRWFASTLLQSKSNAISSVPLGFSTWEVSLHQRRLYRLFPVSTTHLAAAYTFIPRDLLADPTQANLNEPRYAGELSARTLLVNLFGPIESQKTLNKVQYQGFQLRDFGDPPTIWGSLRVRVDTSGNLASVTPAVDTGQQSEHLWEYNVPDAGVTLKVAFLKLSLTNNDPAFAPNALPLLLVGTHSWPDVSVWQFDLALTTEGRVERSDLTTLISRLKALKAKKATHPLTIGNRTVPAEFVGYSVEFLPTPAHQVALVNTARRVARLVFVEKPGGV